MQSFNLTAGIMYNQKHFYFYSTHVGYNIVKTIHILLMPANKNRGMYVLRRCTRDHQNEIIRQLNFIVNWFVGECIGKVEPRFAAGWTCGTFLLYVTFDDATWPPSGNETHATTDIISKPLFPDIAYRWPLFNSHGSRLPY